MKHLIICICMLAAFTQTEARPAESDPAEFGIIKFDVLKMMGFGIQEINFGYEINPIKSGENLFPTLQLNVGVPINSFVTDLNMNIGVNAGAQLRFYFSKSSEFKNPRSWYYGFGISGGWTDFSRTRTYRHINNWEIYRDYEFEYNQVRTNLFGVFGLQTQVGDRLYVDLNTGLGLANIISKQKPIEIDPNYEADWEWITNPILWLYEEGNNQRVFVPFTLSVGYNIKSN